MRYYSQSQGKIVDTGEASGSAGLSSFGSSATGGAVNPQNKLFALLALSKKDYQGAYDLLNPKEDPAIAKAREDKQKAQLDVSPVNNLVNTLEKHFQGAGGAETSIPILDRILGVKKNVEGALGFNSEARQFNNQKEGFIASLKGLTGDTGVLTEQDAKRLLKLIPGLGANKEEAQGGFNDLRAQIASKYGTEATTTSLKPNEKNILQLLFPSTAGFVEDIGKKRQNIQELLKTNPEEAQRQAMQYAPSNGGGISGGIMNLIQNRGLSREAFNPAIEVAGAVGTGYGVKSLAGAVKNLPKTLKGGVFTEGAGKAMRTNAVNMSKKTVDGDKIAGDMLDWGSTAVKANPGDTKSINKVVGEVIDSYSGKKFSAKELKSIWDKVDSGYTAQGVTKTATKAQADLALRNSLRKVLEEAAPGWEQGTKLIAKGIKNKKLVKGVGKIAGYGAIGSGAAAVSGYALGKVLNKNQSY